MPRFLEIRIIGHPDDVEQFVNAVKTTNNLGSDSVNYPTKNGKVKRYLDIVIPGLSRSDGKK
jgi:hypothetical protein